MIAGIFHQGSGLGDQLFRYVTSKTLALDKGIQHCMMNIELFKGHSFMKTNCLGGFPDGMQHWNERDVRENGVDIRSYDPEINFVEGNTIIDGSFEDDKYWRHRLPEIREWLKVEPLEMSDDVCVINFRGGEYTTIPDLFLAKEYWDKAISKVTARWRKNFTFEVHTDDPETAKVFFPNYKIISDIALNWRSIRYARHIILSNSAFGILPALLNDNAREIIAPRYWARHNVKTWARPACYYKEFTYI